MIRVVLLVCLGLLLTAIGLGWDTIEYWAVLSSVMALGWLERDLGRKQGVAMILDMSLWRITQIKADLERAERGDPTLTLEQFEETLTKDEPKDHTNDTK